MRWAFALMTSFDVSMPRAFSPAISSRSTAGSMTTPLPMTGTTEGVRMPLGSRWRANFWSPITTVWPALLPPW
jgi:hypothetical protein